MMKENQNKWDLWASIVHGEARISEGEIREDTESDKDFVAVGRIFSLREKVGGVRKLRSEDEAWSELKGKLFPRRRLIALMKYAAVFLISLFITGSVFWIYYSRQIPGDEYASISTTTGQISNVTLFDGTNVWLNAGSTLTYKPSFNRNNREVILEGEALFSVTKNDKIPFVVHAGDAQIKVLGTEFNVKAYRDEPQIETVLIEGEVQFLSPDKSVMMKPGEQVLFFRSSGEMVKNVVNADEYISWKGGKIHFNGETLLSLTRQLERWYEVKFSFQDERIKFYRFSGVINKERSLGYTLNIIQDINKVKFEFNNDQIMVKDK